VSINIFEANREKSNWKFSVNLSMNILERIPRLMEMLIYACITVINNNLNTINVPKMNDNSQSKYLTYFEAHSLYYSEDIMKKYFENNYFGQLLKDNLRINYNINNYLFQEKSNNVFVNTKNWENNLSKEDYFCIYASLGEHLFSQQIHDNYDLIKEIENIALMCKENNPGINESGIKLEINYILQELTNKYTEFLSYNSSKITLNEAREKFFNSDDIKRIFLDMKSPLIQYYTTIINAIYSDFSKLNSLLIFIQTIFDGFLFFINILIIICLLSIIIKGEEYKKLFAYFLEIPKNINN
jgi:hypothetical protein